MTDDPKFIVKAIGALIEAQDAVEEMERIGLISPQQSTELTIRFLNLEVKAFRQTGRDIEAGMVEAQVAGLTAKTTASEEAA